MTGSRNFSRRGHGIPNCRYCGISQLDEAALEAHIRTCVNNPHVRTREEYAKFKQEIDAYDHTMGELGGSVQLQDHVEELVDAAKQAAKVMKQQLVGSDFSGNSSTIPPQRSTPSTRRGKSIIVALLGEIGSGRSSTTRGLIKNLRGDENDITIEETGHIWWRFTSPKSDYTVVEPVGPKEFLRNVITGMFHADCSLVVIDSTQEFKSSIEVREHLLLSFALGVTQVICCLNKMDVVAPDSKSRFEILKEEVLTYLIEEGYNTKKISIIPISSLRGDNLTERSDNFHWYNGLTVLEALHQVDPPARSDEPLRVPIQKVKSKLMTGRVYSGTLLTGGRVLFGPAEGRLESKVEKVIFENEEVAEAVTGQLVEFTTKLEPDLVKVVKAGFMAYSKQSPAKQSTFFSTRVLNIGGKKVEKGSKFKFFATTIKGDFEVAVIIENLSTTVDPKTGAFIKRNPQCLEIGEFAMVDFSSETPVFLEKVTDLPPLGRFMIMDMEKKLVIAVGVVTGIEPSSVTASKRKGKGKSKKH